MAFFQTENIYKQYANHLALNDVSISVDEGKVFGLLGPNGAGKTTLIRIINQITAPDKGTITFQNEILQPKHTYEIGYLPEERGLYKKMKVGEQAIYLARLKGLSKKDALLKLRYWFQKFEIESWWDKKVEDLSKGMQQKIQFIVTVLHEPKLLIFDEPFSGFDPINANLLKQEIKELKNNGTTIIFSTHNMNSVEEICDDLALINKSEKILSGSIQSIREQYKSNRYEVHFSGEFNKFKAALSSDYRIESVKKANQKQIVTVTLLANYTTNELISKMIQFGNLVQFTELIPNMNDIFIQVVNDFNSKNSSHE